MLGHGLVDHAGALAQRMPLVAAGFPLQVVGTAEPVVVLPQSQQDLPLFREADQILHIDALRAGLVQAVDAGRGPGTPVGRPAGVVGIDGDVVALAVQDRAALLVGMLEAHQQVMRQRPGLHQAGQVQRMGGGAVAGGLPGIVLVHPVLPVAATACAGLSLGVAPGATEHVVEVLIGRAAAGHPAQLPRPVEVVAQVRAQHLQLVLHEVTRPCKAGPDRDAGRQFGVGWPPVRHTPDLVPSVLTHPAQARAGIHQNAGREHLVAVADAMAEAVRLLAVSRQAQRHVPIQDLVQVQRATDVPP